MAIKSLFISLLVTIMLGYSLTVGLTDPDSYLKKIPDWMSFVLLIVFALLYILAFWWAIQGFNAHKVTALFSMALCVFGLSIYAFGIVMSLGSGRASPGQYDGDISTLVPSEKAAFDQLLHTTGLTPQQVKLTEHWHLMDKDAPLKICLQKGHITGLSVLNVPIREVGVCSQFPELGQVYLRGCRLSDMSGLKNLRIERLELADNAIRDLKTLSGCPNVRWLMLQNNQITSKAGIELFPQLIAEDFTGNPLQKDSLK
ncbi:hypothetical protein [Runella sp.]|uniref:hypothetical protein n=1 Tax=Runella sp. TaxID=1960881 RepID=UPI003D11571D